MMSSDEDALGPDDKARGGGNKKRPRQRVDAGEPRNSYSQLSSSVQQFAAVSCRPNGYIMSPGSKLLSDLLARQKDCDEGLLNGYKPASNGYFSDAELYAAQEMLAGQMLFRGGGGKFPDEELSVSGGHASETTPGSATAVTTGATTAEAEKESDSDPGRMSSAGSRSSSPSPTLHAQDVVKRARVETIVSNMMQGPVRSPLTSTPATVVAPPAPVNGCKKRKLYQPQQHEARLLEDDDTDTEEVEDEDEDEEDHLPGKRRRVDRRSLKSQLSQMQEQLAVLQQRYLELCEAQTTSQPAPQQDEEERDDCGSPDPEDRNGPNSPDSSKGLLPRRSCIVKPGVPAVSLSDDLEWLVEALKSELSSTLGQVIDATVCRYAQRKANKDTPGPQKEFHLLSQMLDRKSPRTKVIDRGGAARLTNGHHPNGPILQPLPPQQQRTSPFPDVKLFPSPSLKALQPYCSSPGLSLPPYPPPPAPPQPPLTTTPELPEQTEAMSLVVAPKKKRHKVTDTRITPRTVSRLLGQDMDPKYASLLSLPVHEAAQFALHHHLPHHHQQQQHQTHLPGGPPPPLVPVSLPTTVAIPNPSLHQSDVFSSFHFERLAAAAAAGHFGHGGRDSPDDDSFLHGGSPSLNSSAASLLGGGGGHGSPPDHYGSLHTTPNSHHQHLKQEMLGGEGSDAGDSQGYDTGLAMHTSTLTPMHLRKAKLMFFYVRYPSSAILKMYFPDIKFNKNNTAQLVKWFSNFREFYYIQMEKYARQSLGEGTKSLDDLKVGADSELLRILNLHYNRNNHIEVPEHFRFVVEQTLREFFKAIAAGKDQEQSWKKTIYKVIARLDDGVPEYFKSPNFLEQLE